MFLPKIRCLSHVRLWWLHWCTSWSNWSQLRFRLTMESWPRRGPSRASSSTATRETGPQRLSVPDAGISMGGVAHEGLDSRSPTLTIWQRTSNSLNGFLTTRRPDTRSTSVSFERMDASSTRSCPFVEYVPTMARSSTVWRSFQDITDRKQQENREHALQQMREAIWQLDSTSQVSDILAALEQALKDIGVQYEVCGVNLIDEAGSGGVYHNLSVGEAWGGGELLPEDAGLITRFREAGQTTYRADFLRRGCLSGSRQGG